MKTAQTQLLPCKRKSPVPASMVTMVTGPTSVPPTCPSPCEALHGNQTSASRKLVRPVATVGEPRRTPPPSRGDLKMYSQRFGVVQREVKGPTPKVVIVVSTRCVCGIVPFSASSRTPGLAEPNLAPSPGSLWGAGA